MNSRQAASSLVEMSVLPLEDDQRWQLVQRIISSNRFARAPLLSKFLQHICVMTLEERQHEISEYQIGVQVFDRSQGYRTFEDNIVRNYARQLRKRLAEYFEAEGKLEPLRVRIPLGGYVPEFFSAASENVFSIDEKNTDKDPFVTTISNSRPPPKVRWSATLLKWIALLAYSTALVFLTLFISSHVRGARMQNGPVHPLWSVLFRPPLNTLVVPSDAGFNIIEDLSQKQLSLSDYLKEEYRTISMTPIDKHSASDLSTQKFTSFVDLQVLSTLLRLPETDPQRLFLRFPRDLGMDDLKTGNVILLGAIGSNPWAEVAQQNLNFRILYSNEKQQAWIVNVKPQTGEANTYVSHWNEAAHKTYATIAFTPNLGGNGHILLIQGLDVAGTQAAAEMLFRGDAVAPILNRASLPGGNLRSFEIVIESTSIESNAANAHVIASRIY